MRESCYWARVVWKWSQFTSWTWGGRHLLIDEVKSNVMLHPFRHVDELLPRGFQGNMNYWSEDYLEEKVFVPCYRSIFIRMCIFYLLNQNIIRNYTWNQLSSHLKYESIRFDADSCLENRSQFVFVWSSSTIYIGVGESIFRLPIWLKVLSRKKCG